MQESDNRGYVSIIEEEVAKDICNVHPLAMSLSDKLESLFRGWNRLDNIVGKFGATGLIGGGALLMASTHWPSFYIPSYELFMFSSAVIVIGVGSTALWGASKGIKEVSKYIISDFMRLSQKETIQPSRYTSRINPK